MRVMQISAWGLIFAGLGFAGLVGAASARAPQVEMPTRIAQVEPRPRLERTQPVRPGMEALVRRPLVAAPVVIAATNDLSAAEQAPRFSETLARGAYQNQNIQVVGPDPDEPQWPLSGQEFIQTRLMGPQMAPSLFCTYRRPGERANYRSIRVWQNSRPADLPAEGSYESQMLKNAITSDISLSRCPAQWGQALQAIWGPQAWDELQALHAKRVQLAAQSEAAWTEQAKGKADERMARWKADAAAATGLSPDAERSLRQEVESELQALEANREGVTMPAFNTAWRGGLMEKINRLAQLAHTKSKGLSAIGAARTRFDTWDNQWGGPALTAIVRIDKLVYWRNNRRYTMAEVQQPGNAALYERSNWAQVDLSSLYPAKAAMLETFQLLDRQPLLDAAFMQRLSADLARDRPQGDPGRPYYRYTSPDKKPGWMMSADEQVAQSPVDKFANGIMGMLGEIGNMIRAIDKLDIDIREAREAFWQCYAKRCKEAGATFYAYSYALLAKDYHFFMASRDLPALLRPGMAALGDENVDGGPIPECTSQQRALEAQIGPAERLRNTQPAQAAVMRRDAMRGPAYLAYQACRDRMEYVLRPRWP